MTVETLDHASDSVTLTRPKPDLFFEQECQRLTEVLLKRETRIKEIIESS